MKTSKVDLLPLEELIQTNEVDHADWNYRPLLGLIQRRRFGLIKRLIGDQRYPRILEIGYGSGVFMPELSRSGDELYGIDPHGMNREVTEILARHGIAAELHSGSAEDLPFENDFFDLAVSVSAIEYVPDLDKCCAELDRVLKPGGKLILCTPGFSPLIDLALRTGTGQDPDQYGDRRAQLLPTLSGWFDVDQELRFPPLPGSLFRVYTGVRYSARG